MRIDAYTHFMPSRMFKLLVDSGYPDIGKPVSTKDWLAVLAAVAV